jgi:protein tyrosine/serine phosphatase
MIKEKYAILLSKFEVITNEGRAELIDEMIKITTIKKIIAVGVLMTLPACATTTRESATLIQAGKEVNTPIQNFQIVEPGVLYRGWQPETESDWRFLKENAKIKTIIKLNTYSPAANVEEETRAALRQGIKLIPILMQPEDWPHNWNLWAIPTNEKIVEAINALEQKENWPVYIHCSHGKDRTGLLVAIYRVRNNNYCKSKAFAEMSYYGANPFLFGMKPAFFNYDVKENESCVK